MEWGRGDGVWSGAEGMGCGVGQRGWGVEWGRGDGVWSRAEGMGCGVGQRGWGVEDKKLALQVGGGGGRSYSYYSKLILLQLLSHKFPHYRDYQAFCFIFGVL